jgi:hypothetical protein
MFGITRHMSATKNAILDAALVLGGAGLSTLFISTDGNGQNPVPVAAGMGLVILVSGAVSFGVGGLVRSLPLSIVGSAAITELAFVLYFVCRVAYGKHLDPHAEEELYLLPIVFAVATAPAVLLSSVGFGRMASRAYRGRRAEHAPPNGGPAPQFGNPGVVEGPPRVS